MIFLCILKWIGIILACVLGLAVLLALCILFVPIRYYAKGRYDENKDYQVCFHWLCYILTLRMNSRQAGMRIHVFGIPIGRRKKQSAKEKEAEKDEKQIQVTEMAKKKELSVKNQEQPEKKILEKKQQKKEKNKKEPKKEKAKKHFSFSKISSIIKFVRDQGTKETIRMVKKEAFLLLKHLAPRKAKGMIRFGTGDPASTGMLTGVISMLPFSYQKGVSICPDFEEQCLFAHGTVKGRIQIFYVLRICVRVYRNKEVKKLIAKYKKFKEELSNGR